MKYDYQSQGSFGEEKGRNGKKGQKVEMSYVSFCCRVVIIVLTFAPTFNNRKRHIFLLIFVNHLFETKWSFSVVLPYYSLIYYYVEIYLFLQAYRLKGVQHLAAVKNWYNEKYQTIILTILFIWYNIYLWFYEKIS